MGWQDVPEGYDAPAGERIRIVYEVDVPWWLEWTPDECMDYIMQGLLTCWGQIKSAVADFKVTSYEVRTVVPGDRYQVIIYGVSRGVTVSASAIIFLSILTVFMYLVVVAIGRLQRWVPPIPPVTFPLGALALLLLGVAFVSREAREWRE